MTAELVVTLAAIARDLSLALVAGALLLVATVLPPGAAARRAVTVASASAVVWAISAFLFLGASTSVILGIGPSDELWGPQWWQFATEISLGQSYVHAVIAAVLTSVAVGLVRTSGHALLALIPVVWAIAWQAQTGHAAGAADHHLAVTAMVLHLTGSAGWFGLLAAIALVHRQLDEASADAMRRVSRMAIWAAWFIVISGAINAWLRVGSVGDFFTSAYGRLMLTKLILMSAAIALAAWHRRTTLPRLTVSDVQARFWRILAVDIGLLLMVIAIAGVLAQEPPPAPITAIADPTPTFLLTGYELPPRPSAWNWIGLWRLHLIPAFVIVAVGVVYVRWVVRLRSRGDHWSLARTASFLLGLVIALWVTQGAPAIYGVVTFSGHMIQHMALMIAVPLPMVFGAPVTLALRALPSRHDQSRGPREWLRVIVESRIMTFLAHPVIAAINFAGGMVVFYYSAAFEFALRNHAGHLWMALHFVLVGYLFANALVGIDPGPKRSPYPMRVVLLFATMAFHAFFGVALTTSQALLAPTWFGLMGRTWGPDAISDQHYGGAIAWGVGEIPIVLVAVVVLLQWSKADTRESKRKDRQAERDDDAELRAYNERLARIAARDSDQPPATHP